jgi:hypothetical protein
LVGLRRLLDRAVRVGILNPSEGCLLFCSISVFIAKEPLLIAFVTVGEG